MRIGRREILVQRMKLNAGQPQFLNAPDFCHNVRGIRMNGAKAAQSVWVGSLNSGGKIINIVSAAGPVGYVEYYSPVYPSPVQV